MVSIGMLLTAALLTALIGLVHSILGEIKILRPLLAEENRNGILKSAFVRGVLRFAWHITTVAWFGFAAILAAMALTTTDEQGTVVMGIVALTFLVSGTVALVASRGRHWSWLGFFAIAGLVLGTLL